MKKLLLIFTLSMIEITTSLSQFCTQTNYIFNTQDEIDEFGVNFPDCIAIVGNVTVNGGDVINLNGLNHIVSIGGQLKIIGTSLTTLSELNNLQIIGQDLYIYDNDILASLEGIEAIELFSDNHVVVIRDNPVLEYCQTENLCQFMANYGFSLIYNNALGCKSRDAIIENCLILIDNTPRIECFYDGFEVWSLYNHPLNWAGVIVGGIDGEYNIAKGPALIEGNHSMVLRSNTFFFEGTLPTTIKRDVEGENDLIDITFTYKCLGEGRCQVNIKEGYINSSDFTSTRSIWNVAAGDSTQYTVVLQNIAVNQPYEIIELVELVAHPIYTGLGNFGISEFIIDDFSITKKASTTSLQNTLNEGTKIYPNPAKHSMIIESTTQFEEIIIYNNVGQVMSAVKFTEKINVSELISGIYYLLLIDKEGKRMTKRFVKK